MDSEWIQTNCLFLINKFGTDGLIIWCALTRTLAFVWRTDTSEVVSQSNNDHERSENKNYSVGTILIQFLVKH